MSAVLHNQAYSCLILNYIAERHDIGVPLKSSERLNFMFDFLLQVIADQSLLLNYLHCDLLLSEIINANYIIMTRKNNKSEMGALIRRLYF